MQKASRKIFATLFFALFAAVTGVGIVVPLLPVYAHQLGAAGLAIGALFGAFSLSRTLLLPYFGHQSDRKGRKPYIVSGLLAYTLVALAFTQTHSIVGLILVRFVQGAASAMLMPVIQAYVGDLTAAGKEGATMGVFNMSMFMGLSLGPLMGGLINDYSGINAAFGCMGLLALAGFILACILLPATRTERIINQEVAPVAWRRLLTDREIVGLFLFRAAYTACIGIIWGFLPVYSSVTFKLSGARIGMLVMVGVMFSGAMHLPMGFIADRFSKKAMVLIGGTLVSVSMVLFYLADGFVHLLLTSIVFGCGGGIAMPAIMALAVIKGSAGQAMGSVMALLTMAHSIGMLSGALMAGAMMDIANLKLVFPLGAVLVLLCVVLFSLLNCRGPTYHVTGDTPLPSKKGDADLLG
jgi:MFS family permease